MNKLIDNLTIQFEKICNIEYDEHELLINSYNETINQTLLRYKRYILCIDNWEMLPDVYKSITEYITCPSNILKEKIDTNLILFIESL